MPHKTSRILASLALALCIAGPTQAAPASRPSVASIPLPPRSRPQTDGSYISARSYRNTTAYYRKYLKRTRQAHNTAPSYRVGGTTITRFFSTDSKSPWTAIHVFQNRGLTQIFIVAKPKVDPPPAPV